MDGNNALKHHMKRRRLLSGKPLVNTKMSRFVDMLAYPVGLVGLVSTIPQLYDVWIMGVTEGVSLITWSSWTATSFFWIMYSRIHKAKALVVTHTGWLFVNAAVAIGLVVNS